MKISLSLKPNTNNQESLYWQLSTNPSKENVGVKFVDGWIEGLEESENEINDILHSLNNLNIFQFEYSPQENDRLLLILNSKQENIFNYNGTEWEYEFPFGGIYYYEFGLIIDGSIELEK